ncbi:Short-chain dehydrogenase/reductase SDR [Penicillium odoratum]|uniref:Short-chain dehydrogenase/reductase SDR n=1 Tax=Penicillium odoratum TaxID=1167516 RepID=UPI00254886CC|nr:Short-chain dehydrogenase/reductase SDR [Penicillium odoratum]KAJ5778060.1 Short-chain dehydrogenase/reductase SDR [Penicillium odoratum]
MSETEAFHNPEDTYVLVTGANSGLGFSTCCRLADDFLKTRPPTASLNIIFTTRSARKAQDTARRLEAHLRTTAPFPEDFSRVRFLPESVDLGSLVSVRACSRRLNSTFPKLDAIILNAGVGGFSGIDWPNAIWKVCTDLLHSVTWPDYKLSPVGVLTEKQTCKELEEPALGALFCANVFGHYMLAHNVMPLLKRAKTPDGPGRVVWVSSIEATIEHFDVGDIQALRSVTPYDSSKELTDILALTSDLPGTAPWAVKGFLSSDDCDDANGDSVVPTMHVSHPGVCATAIIPLALPLIWAMMIAFWGARMLGSPWHNMSTYLGAISPVSLALSSKTEIEAAEKPYRQAGGGKPKWGSSTSRLGTASVVCTEVEGWGYGGVVGTPVVEADRQRRRKRRATYLTVEQKENFEELGRQCWKQMEELRVKWDGILDQAEKMQNDR